MSRKCMVTGKAVMSGNNVSHSMRRTKRKFVPNIQDTSLFSEALGRKIRLRVSVNGIRTIEHKGGLDAWLMGTAPTKLDPALRPVRAQVETALAQKAASK